MKRWKEFVDWVNFGKPYGSGMDVFTDCYFWFLIMLIICWYIGTLT